MKAVCSAGQFIKRETIYIFFSANFLIISPFFDADTQDVFTCFYCLEEKFF